MIVGKISEIKDGCAKIIQEGNEIIAVFNKGGCFYAIENSCPHRGGPLGESELKDNFATCPWHAWRFDVTTGECPDIPGEKVKTYPCRVEGEEIVVEIKV